MKNYFYPFLILFLTACGLTRSLTDDDFKYVEDEAALATKLAYLQEHAKLKSDAANIIWIIVDDLGLADTDLYGSGTVQTTNINRLADEGVRFTNSYVTSPVCGPSRAAIYTGRYNQRFGFEHQQHNRYLKNKLEYHSFRFLVNSKPWYIQKQDSVPNQAFMKTMGIPNSEITIAEVLKKYGYKTGLFGKWHLTSDRSRGPNNFGFDEFYGFMNSHSLYGSPENENLISIRNKKDWTDKYIWKDGRDNLSAIERNGQIVEEDRYLTEAITAEAISFIEQSSEPFFAVLSYNAPHTPFQATEEAYQRFSQIKDPIKRTYAAMIYSLDEEIGKLHQYLENNDLLENTLVFFISDNGGAEYTLATDNGAYKGGKITNFEGGLKVPMFMLWPGRVAPGETYDESVSSLDMFSTTLKAVGINSFPRTIDGTDLTSAVTNNKVAHDYIYFRNGISHGIRSQYFKLTWNDRTSDSLLFDITRDRFEQQNIYGQHQAELNKLRQAYANWQQEMASPRWPAMIDYRFKDEDGKVYWFEN